MGKMVLLHRSPWQSSPELPDLGGLPHPIAPPSPARTDTMKPAQARLLSPESHRCQLRHPHTPQGPRTLSHPPCTGERRGLQAAPGSSAAQGPHPSRTAPAGETIKRDRGPQAMRHKPGDASAVPSTWQAEDPAPAARCGTGHRGAGGQSQHKPCPGSCGEQPQRPPCPRPPVLTAVWSCAGGRAELGSSTPGSVPSRWAWGERRKPESSPEALPTE